MDFNKYIDIKNRQLDIYADKAKLYRKRSKFFAFCMVMASVLTLFFGHNAWMAVEFGVFNRFIFNSIVTVLFLLIGNLLEILRRHHQKSSMLLWELVDELESALRIGNFDQMSNRVLAVETDFLSNDDELYTKKYIWPYFLQYLDLLSEMDKNAKAEGMRILRNQVNVSNSWTWENPLNMNNDDTDYINLNWMIKRRLRELFFKSYPQQRNILDELSDEANTNPIVYERFLRNKKISRKLKKFKRVVNVFYLSPAAKMKLICFVDSVLQQRPYMEQSHETKQLIRDKNSQIKKYTDDFWRIHRRSLKFYFFEAVWLGLMVPVLLATFYVSYHHGTQLAYLTFYLGAGIVVFGEMALVTRQLRDLKSKKLVPSLIAQLMGIRHSMCYSVGTSPEIAEKYERHFKEAEKRFMLTVTEVEAVKYAKENVTKKVRDRLSYECKRIKEIKDEQAGKYYERFLYYRRQCLKYGALEAFVGLLIFPAILSLLIEIENESLFVFFGFELAMVAIGLAIELVLLIRHIRVDRRKELFLLIYQKMSVILSDYTIFSDKERILRMTNELEDSIIDAAHSDRMNDVVKYVSKWHDDDKAMFKKLNIEQIVTDAQVIYEQIPAKNKIDAVRKKTGNFLDKFSDDK